MASEIKREADYIDFICKVLKENFNFAQQNGVAREASTEIIELLNDVADLLHLMPETEEFVKSTKWNYIVTNLMPSSYGIYLNFLAGNIPACFMQLRNTIEYVCECFTADKGHPEEGFFYQKLLLSEERRKREDKSLSKIIEEVDREAAQVWHRSSDWIHAQSLAKKLVEHVIERGVPAWSLTIPMIYDENDEQSLGELQRSVKQFRAILQRILRRWNDHA